MAAINCEDYINGPLWDTLTAGERQNAISELYLPKYLLCPDVGTITLDSGITGLHTFLFKIKKKGASAEEISNTTVG